LQAQNDKTKPIDERLVPTRDEAVKLYEERGGQLTFWPEFGIDPLSDSAIMASRHSNEFNANFPNLNDLFYEVVNNDFTNFRNAISLFRDLKYQYSS